MHGAFLRVFAPASALTITTPCKRGAGQPTGGPLGPARRGAQPQRLHRAGPRASGTRGRDLSEGLPSQARPLGAGGVPRRLLVLSGDTGNPPGLFSTPWRLGSARSPAGCAGEAPAPLKAGGSRSEPGGCLREVLPAARPPWRSLPRGGRVGFPLQHS